MYTLAVIVRVLVIGVVSFLCRRVPVAVVMAIARDRVGSRPATPSPGSTSAATLELGKHDCHLAHVIGHGPRRLASIDIPHITIPIFFFVLNKPSQIITLVFQQCDIVKRLPETEQKKNRR